VADFLALGPGRAVAAGVSIDTISHILLAAVPGAGLLGSDPEVRSTARRIVTPAVEQMKSPAWGNRGLSAFHGV
jgi:hypothetical protein